MVVSDLKNKNKTVLMVVSDLKNKNKTVLVFWKMSTEQFEEETKTKKELVFWPVIAFLPHKFGTLSFAVYHSSSSPCLQLCSH